MAKWEQELKVGCGFRPYDEELVGYFLHHKILGNNHLVEDFISEVDIGSVDPWNLRLKSKIKSRDHICYFFRENKYEDRNRQSRKTPSGKWNITGKPLDVKDQRGIWSEGGGTIGFKKYLRFLKPNSNKNDKSWSMQEFHYTLLPEAQRTYVLCRLEYKGDDKNVILVNPTDPMTNSRGYAVDQPVQGNTGSLNDLPEFDLANERNTGSLNNLPEFDLANQAQWLLPDDSDMQQSSQANTGYFSELNSANQAPWYSNIFDQQLQAPYSASYGDEWQMMWNYVVGERAFMEAAMNEVNIHSFDPWDLSLQAKIKSKIRKWYFFSRLENMYTNGNQQFRGQKRRTPSGVWKITGKPADLKAQYQTSGGVRGRVGYKQIFVFIGGSGSGRLQSGWVMHEYHCTLLPEEAQRTFVLCKLVYTGDDVNILSHSPPYPLPTTLVPSVTDSTASMQLQAPYSASYGDESQRMWNYVVNERTFMEAATNEVNINSFAAMKEVNINSFDPWDLSLQAKIKSENRSWYFFSRLEFLYSNLKVSRPKRSTPSGFWKPTGTPRDLKAQCQTSGGVRGSVGYKQIFVFYVRSGSGRLRSNWVMHEYHCTLLPKEAQRTFVLCKLKYKGDDVNILSHSPPDPLPTTLVPSVADITASMVDQSILGNSGFFNRSFEQGELFGGELNQQQLSVGTSSTLFNTFSDFGLANQDQPQQFSIEQSVLGNSDISFNNAFSNVMNPNHWFSSNLNQQQLMNPNQWFSSNLNSQQLFEGTSCTLFNTFSDFGLANQDQPQQFSIEQSVLGDSDISFNNAFSDVMNPNQWFSSNLNSQQQFPYSTPYEDDEWEKILTFVDEENRHSFEENFSDHRPKKPRTKP